MKMWSQWPKLVRISASLLGGALMLALAYILLAGAPRPVLPSSSLFEPVSIEQTLSSSRPELSSFDFIFRPVFALTRKPSVQPELMAKDEAALRQAEAAATVVKSIEGVNLLGIFGSGEVEGAIVRLDNGERHRLGVGQKLEGWTLQSVSAREIRFVTDSGEVADLDMILSQSQQPLAEPSVAGERQKREAPPERPAEPEPKADEETEEAAQAASLTFESMYRDRIQQQSRKKDAE